MGTGGRRAAATDQTRVLAAGVGGSNSEMSVTTRPACVSGGRERRRVKGTDGRVSRDRWTVTIPGCFLVF